MKYALILAGLLMVTPAFALNRAVAADLTPAQSSAIETQTKLYFKALYSGDFNKLGQMTTHNYHVYTKDGKMISDQQMGKAMGTISLNSSQSTGNVKIDSVAPSPSGDRDHGSRLCTGLHQSRERCHVESTAHLGKRDPSADVGEERVRKMGRGQRRRPLEQYA